MVNIVLPDDSSFFIVEIDTAAKPPRDPIYWNPWNKVVQDHRDGTIDHVLTEMARRERGLPLPWTPSLGAVECTERPIF